ncbi:hypothetical protein BCIN_14g05520 [Botrytis cinerea B05.10]|uniref:DUF6590 domain-containing protein n=1 Tax=Botryotinia fuckeliana (strain B05.10) TaxID=332648 RepID=A0A384K3L0_BOTFB|nr:hypothetical protein BCIN_14g05520 [Botrytis cinerea B05.10]ATZ57410.1 hypothetical protein BCIN_14g05520 [Botrytis cinerea B05.10]
MGSLSLLLMITHKGRATSKPGVRIADHANIYTTEPKLIPNENGSEIVFQPIRMIPYSARHHFDSSSRINYVKVYTLEYNFEVWFIHEIHECSVHALKSSYSYAPTPSLSRPTQITNSSSYPTKNSRNSNSLDVPGRSTSSY